MRRLFLIILFLLTASVSVCQSDAGLSKDPVTREEAREMGLEIPEPASGEFLYLGSADSNQAEKFAAAFTVDPTVSELDQLVLLVYHADAENGAAVITDMTVQIRTDKRFPVSDGLIETDSFLFRNFRFTETGAEADLTVTLHLPVMNSVTDFTFNEVHMIFRKAGDSDPFLSLPEAEVELVQETDEPAADTDPFPAFSGSEMLDSVLEQVMADQLPWGENPEQSGWGRRIAVGIYDPYGVQTENSFTAAQNGEDFYGIPADRLAKTAASVDTVILVQNPIGTSKHANIAVINWAAREVSEISVSGEDYMPPEDSGTDPARYYLMMLAEIPDSALNRGYTPELELHGENDIPELYRQAQDLFREGKFYSARRAFLESKYWDWEEMAALCIQPWPASGEIRRDPTQWLQDLELTFSVDQPDSTGMFIRIFKNGKAISDLFVAGSGEVSVKLPGNAYYSIKYGAGEFWFGEKEAFGPEGEYRTLIFDDSGTDRIRLQTNTAYTFSLSSSTSKPADWDDFTEE